MKEVKTPVIHTAREDGQKHAILGGLFTQVPPISPYMIHRVRLRNADFGLRIWDRPPARCCRENNPGAEVAKKTGNYWPHTGPPGTGARGEKMPVLMAVMAKKKGGGAPHPDLLPGVPGRRRKPRAWCSPEYGMQMRTSNIQHRTLNVERRPAEAGTTNRKRTLIYADCH